MLRRISIAPNRICGLILFTLLSGRLNGSPTPGVRCALDIVTGPFVSGGHVELRGWAADERFGGLAERMELRLDRHEDGDVSRRRLREDVASTLGRPDLLWSGWSATVSLRGVPAGPHTVEVFAFSHDGRGTSCGEMRIDVREAPVPEVLGPGAHLPFLLFQIVLFTGWLVIAGWGLLRFTGRPESLLGAPAAGLSLLLIGSEWGFSLGIGPLLPAVAVTVLSLTLLALSYRRSRPRRPSLRRGIDAGSVCLVAAAFVGLAIVPLMTWGPLSILGAISDASRHCAIGDALTRFGGPIHDGVPGYVGEVSWAWQSQSYRFGIAHAMGAFSAFLNVRTSDVHSAVALSAGILVVLGAGTLASRLLPRSGFARAVAATWTALSSVLLVELHGQHVGLLAATGLYLAFLASLSGLSAGPIRRIVPPAVLLAGVFSLYPESLPLWGLTALLAVPLLGRARRIRRITGRALLIGIFAVALNPLGFRPVPKLFRQKAEIGGLSTAEGRERYGDTSHFPSLLVATGMLPYQIDAPAPMGRLRTPPIVVTSLGLFAMALLGFRRLSSRRRLQVLWLLLPVACGLLVARLLRFPYGYSRFLVHLVPVVAAAWVLCVAGLRETSRGSGRRIVVGALAALVSVQLAFSAWSLRHLIRRQVRAVPAWDAVYEHLPEMERAVGVDTTFLIDEPDPARFEWMAYYLGGRRTRLLYSGPGGAPAPGAVVKVVDLRLRKPEREPLAANRFFALVPVGSGR